MISIILYFEKFSFEQIICLDYSSVIGIAYKEKVSYLVSCPRWSIWLGYQTLTLMGRVQSPGAELFIFFFKTAIYKQLDLNSY